ncbi:MAG: hypothetical protein K1X65_14955 [Caldilineales bacterium]|nr:hypothetical protein [Caldilineales bacterium]MCW5856987.1 hypothetical protein [Caldilineales bacterium]
MAEGSERMAVDEPETNSDNLLGLRDHRIDIDGRLVECWIKGESPGPRFETPWAVIEVGEEVGGGRVVGVEAWEDFDLCLHTGATSFFEHLTPGYHRLLLTLLDRTDVVAIPP